MITLLAKLGGEESSRALRSNQLGLVVEAVLTGIGFVLLVPLLRALLQEDLMAAGAWLGGLLALVVLYAVVRYRTQLSGYLAAVDLARCLFRRLGEHIAQLPLGWFGVERIGELGRLTSQGVIDVIGVPAHLLRPVFSALITPSTVVLLMFLFDWRLASAALITAPLLALVYRWTGDLVQRTDARVHEAATVAAGRIVEFAQRQPVLRAFRRGRSSLGELDAALQAQRVAGRAQLFTAAKGFVSFVLVVQFAFTLLLLFGTSLALGGRIDTPELVALLVLAVRYVEPLLGAADLEGALRISRNSLSRMHALLATAPLAEPAPSCGLAPRGADVTFERVRFAYDDTPILKNMSFSAPANAMTAIVGGSGSGKTTILRLIARFWDVSGGSVRIGGVDVREMTSEVLMAHISVVFQDVYLFDGSIMDNIRLGRLDASDEQVREAARLARVDEVAARLPDGLRTAVGEGGASLSGGERQRVSIARAILKDAPIILLDEATSALDPLNEAAVQGALQALTGGKTIIIVAHRLSTVRNADQILVLADGAIQESGPHAELRAMHGRYAEFWSGRERASGWRLGTSQSTA
ncbi:MAG: ABC transporter ATP-binding protein [Pseudomonadota bacterium]